MAQAVPEGFRGLTGQGATGSIGDGAGNHDRQLITLTFKHFLYCKHRCLGIQGVKNGFDQNQVTTTANQGFGGFNVVFHQQIKGDIAVAGIIHIRRNGSGATGWTQHPGHITGFIRC